MNEMQLRHQNRSWRRPTAGDTRRPKTPILDEADDGRGTDQDEKGTESEEVDSECSGGNESQHHALDGGSSQTSDGIRDDGHDNRLDPEQYADTGVRRPVAHVAPSENQNEQHRRNDEAQAANDEPGPAHATACQHERHLGRRRTREKARPPDQIEQFLLGHPAPTVN